ncbi:hypothetical protein ACTFIZ_002492 [Dictyostelium cf. discoideum]
MESSNLNNSNNIDNEEIKVKFNKAKQIERENIFFPVKEENEKVYKIEGLLSYVTPENKTTNGNLCEGVAIVVTHPHPMLGGSYRNNVVLGVVDYISTYLQVPTLCFNFRGVGKSEGKGSWFGSSERLDTIAAVNYLLSTKNLSTPVKHVIIVGYSYGSVIGSSVADSHDSIKAFTSISYPFGPLTLMLLGSLLKHALNSPKPKLFLTGDNDNFTSVSTFKKRMNEFKHSTNLETKIFDGDIDHFYGGNERNLAKEISKWIIKVSLDFDNQN